MRKTTALLALIGAMLCTFSCMEKTEPGNGYVPKGYHEEIITTIIPGGGTRTSFDNTTGVFSWTEGDEIAFHLSNGEYISAPIDIETGKVRLLIPDGVTRDEFAVYPASAAVEEHDTAEDMQLMLPDNYDISEGLMSEYCPTTMLAVQDPNSSTLHFNHAGAIIQLNLTLPAYTYSVDVEFTDKTVTGTIPVNNVNSYYKLNLDESTDNADSKIVFMVSENIAGLEEETQARINVPVPSGTYEEIKITFNDGTKDTYEYDHENTVSVSRGGGRRITPVEADYEDAINYFWVEALEDDCRVTFRDLQYNSSWYAEMYYSFDKVNWTKCPTYYGQTLSKTGQRVYYKNTNGMLNGPKNSGSPIKLSATKKIKVGGLISTLKDVNARNKEWDENITETYTYNSLFQDCTNLVDASELDLGGNFNIYEHGFDRLFQGCYELISPPITPATKLAPYCYRRMFAGCTKLETPPVLPATNLEEGCYQYMFENDFVLQYAPELPATILTTYGYQDMFANCKALELAPELPAETLAEGCYNNMFRGCISLQNTYDLPATVMERSCYAGMFNGCSSLQTAPKLPATTLAENCYYGMFGSCSSLQTAPALPATTLTDYCYYSMFSQCTSLEKAPELPATILAPYCYNGMFWGCTSLNEITCLAVDTTAEHCLGGWTENVSSTGTFYRNILKTDWPRNDNPDIPYSGIPQGWTVYAIEEITPQI